MSLDRYNRQILLPFIGEEGQKRICASTAVVAGCGFGAFAMYPTLPLVSDPQRQRQWA